MRRTIAAALVLVALSACAAESPRTPPSTPRPGTTTTVPRPVTTTTTTHPLTTTTVREYKRDLDEIAFLILLEIWETEAVEQGQFNFLDGASDFDRLELAHMICTLLATGTQDVVEIYDTFIQTWGVASHTMIVNLMKAAIRTFCPEYDEQIQSLPMGE